MPPSRAESTAQVAEPRPLPKPVRSETKSTHQEKPVDVNVASKQPPAAREISGFRFGSVVGTGVKVGGQRPSPKPSSLPTVVTAKAGYEKDRKAVEDDVQFGALSASVKKLALTQLGKHKADPTARKTIMELSTSQGFSKLSLADQAKMLRFIGGSNLEISKPARGGLQTLLSSPGFKAANAADQAKQLEKFVVDQQSASSVVSPRPASVKFTPGPGLKLIGSAQDKKEFLTLLRKTMKQSPSFRKLMQEINNDKKRPIEMQVGRNNVYKSVSMNRFVLFDQYLGKGKHVIDLADFGKFPTKPPKAYPNAVTQGQLLAHVMAEQRFSVLSKEPGGVFKDAHKAGFRAENLFRKEIGQQGKLIGDDVLNTRPDGKPTVQFEQVYVMKFDNGYKEYISINNNKRSVNEIIRGTQKSK